MVLVAGSTRPILSKSNDSTINDAFDQYRIFIIAELSGIGTCVKGFPVVHHPKHW